jgi:adenylate kinase
MLKLVFFGAPGAGKGTLAKIMKENTGIIQISTGDLFRHAIKHKTELGLKVEAVIKAGGLVPDELTIALVAERVKNDDCKDGYILDGFPRTLPQAEEWEKRAPIDTAVYFDISDEIVKKRLSGRRTCEKCGSIYNIYSNKPRTEGICDKDGEKLSIRSDDREEAIANRLDVYHSQTKPLLAYYEKLGKVVTIDASVDPQSSYDQIMSKIKL